MIFGFLYLSHSPERKADVVSFRHFRVNPWILGRVRSNDLGGNTAVHSETDTIRTESVYSFKSSEED